MTGPSALLNVKELLDSHLPHDADASWYRAPEIPVAKLTKAIAKYGEGISAASVLALGDGTVFGSAKEGVLITADTLYSHTGDGRFLVRLEDVASAKKVGGWPSHGIELSCRDGSTHAISTICFEKNQESLVDFLGECPESSSAGVGNQEFVPVAVVETTVAIETTLHESLVSSESCEILAEPVVPVGVNQSRNDDSSVRSVNAGLKLIGVCQRDGFDNAGKLFAAAARADEEWSLLKGYCRYVGFNGREVDAVFLITNRRLQLFSMEMGAKIFCVEMTKRLLGKLPVPFFDSLVGLVLFTIPRSIYVALRGGKENLIAQALGLENEQLLSASPPLRKVHEHDFARLAKGVAQVEIGTGVCTGFLDRKFGVTFAPRELAKTFSVPKDMILSEHDSPEPIERLLRAASATLANIGWSYRLDDDGKKLTLLPVAAEQKTAA